MGFWTIYMGIYGGGSTAAVVVPDVPGCELTVGNDRSQYKVIGKTQYNVDNTRLHYRVIEEQ